MKVLNEEPKGVTTGEVGGLISKIKFEDERLYISYFQSDVVIIYDDPVEGHDIDLTEDVDIYIGASATEIDFYIYGENYDDDDVFHAVLLNDTLSDNFAQEAVDYLTPHIVQFGNKLLKDYLAD